MTVLYVACWLAVSASVCETDIDACPSLLQRLRKRLWEIWLTIKLTVDGVGVFLFALLSSLELSDTEVYEPQIRALLGAASDFCEVAVSKLRTG